MDIQPLYDSEDHAETLVIVFDLLMTDTNWLILKADQVPDNSKGFKVSMKELVTIWP